MATAPKLPDSQQDMIELLSSLSDEELQEMFQAHAELERRLQEYGPQNDDELHAWLIAELGIDIPREAVCEGHDAPFTFIADLYFERTDAALLMANRGGSKTFLVALLHWLNSRFKPGCESATFGATEAQSLRAYAHLKNWIYDDDGNKRPEIAASIMRETTWRNGSRVEVLPGTPAAVNGPHPQKAHADEVELMDEGTWKESRNMTVSKRTKDGRLIKPQDIATSTRKGPNGRMQQLIDEIEAAVKAGMSPPRKLYVWCIKETAAQVSNCQVAYPDLADDVKCPCHTIAKGEWEPGRPRLLRDVCNGDLARSRGWQPLGDVIKHFRENDRETFEVQQLCARPEMSHHYVPNYTSERYGLRDFLPDPDYCIPFLAVDWGGTNPHAVNWYALLTQEIEAKTFLPGTRRLKEGTIVCYDEIYIAEIGNDKLADMVIAREKQWQERFPDFSVYERFADPQGKAARMDWADKGLRTVWRTTREFEEHIKAVRGLFDDDLMYVDVIRCPMWVEEIKAWRRDEKTGKQIDEFNHAMSNFRYAIANIKKVQRKALRSKNVPQARPIPRQTVSTTRGQGPIAFRGRDDFADWRRSLGEPVTRRNS